MMADWKIFLRTPGCEMDMRSWEDKGVMRLMVSVGVILGEEEGKGGKALWPWQNTVTQNNFHITAEAARKNREGQRIKMEAERTRREEERFTPNFKYVCCFVECTWGVHVCVHVQHFSKKQQSGQSRTHLICIARENRLHSHMWDTQKM